MANTRRQLSCSDIGYNGKPLEKLTKDELIDFCIKLAQSNHDCSTDEAPCKNVFSVGKTLC